MIYLVDILKGREGFISGDTSLSRDAFVKGMWLIDEELRLAQNALDKAARGRNQP